MRLIFAWNSARFMLAYRGVKSLIVVLILSLTLAAEQPKSMIKIEVILQSPDVPATSFGAKPKIMYRAGSKYCRIEEQSDPDHGIHALVIVNEPDAWMVNLISKTAKHVIDPGPTLNCRLPIFADDPRLALEFGKELEYFRSKGAVSEKGPVMQTKETTAYKLDLEGIDLGMFTYGTPERPLAVVRVRGEKSEIFWYSGYGDLPFDLELFTKPDNVRIEEPKP